MPRLGLSVGASGHVDVNVGLTPAAPATPPGSPSSGWNDTGTWNDSLTWSDAA